MQAVVGRRQEGWIFEFRRAKSAAHILFLRFKKLLILSFKG